MFIEVHSHKKPTLINLDTVEEIQQDPDGGAILYFTVCLNEQDWLKTDETYAQIRRLVAKTQGGIPIGDVG